MEQYYNLLGLHLEEVEKFFTEKNIKYSVNYISGKKDKETLIIPRVIKIYKSEDSVELLTTYFSDSL